GHTCGCFFSSRRRHTSSKRDWSSDVCSSDLRQAYLIGKAGFKRIYLAADNDEQGRNLNRKLATSLRGMAELYVIDYGRYKDANEIGRASCRDREERAVADGT